ncbi:prostaglandin reductase 1-like [Amyelois transitella]|uniref:prostaglandin reductase 1-like n=1 Tax=Amyelois transitella TaxID=680683 RepID=UPI00298F75ED|nr:prostaglandin reductase 1-like [Amyelois transitella]
MVKAKKYVVTSRFKGMPKLEDFNVVEEELPPLKDGEVLVKTEWISVDPYLRTYNPHISLPYDQFGNQIGEVLESKNDNYPVGTKVVSHKGWRDYSVFNPNDSTDQLDRAYKLPDLQGLSESLGIGAVGMPGATAYFGFLEICKPKAGETVVVTGAAGAVGSIVGQIAKIKGCKVIGFAGSDDKVQWLEKDLGFDKAINYKTADVLKELKQAAPKGIDCYFDNVGGELSSIIISLMNLYGRVSVCGMISSYNSDSGQSPKGTLVQPSIVFNQLKIEGFVVARWVSEWPDAFNELVQWIKNGKLKAKEHVTEGFDRLFDAFVGMLAGDNFGKAVVKV